MDSNFNFKRNKFIQTLYQPTSKVENLKFNYCSVLSVRNISINSAKTNKVIKQIFKTGFISLRSEFR